MSRRRFDYQTRRADYERRKREHLEERPEGCICHLCLTVWEFDAMIQKRLDANLGRADRIPF